MAVCKPISQPSSQPASQSASQSIIHPASQPSSQIASQPVSQSVSQSASQPSSESDIQPASQPVSQSVNQPISHSAIQPFCQPASQSFSQPVSYSVSQPVSMLACQPVSQSFRQTASKPVSLSANVLVSQPAIQPVGQSANRPPRGLDQSAISAHPSWTLHCTVLQLALPHSGGDDQGMKGPVHHQPYSLHSGCTLNTHLHCSVRQFLCGQFNCCVFHRFLLAFLVSQTLSMFGPQPSKTKSITIGQIFSILAFQSESQQTLNRKKKNSKLLFLEKRAICLK